MDNRLITPGRLKPCALAGSVRQKLFLTLIVSRGILITAKKLRAGLGRSGPWSGIILGETASKANGRRITFVARKPRSIKSFKALAYSKAFLLQCPVLNPLFEADVHADIDLWYANRRSDLDESLILDLLQERVYRNDRQVRSRRVRWGLDSERPRLEISIRLMVDSDYAQ